MASNGMYRGPNFNPEEIYNSSIRSMSPSYDALNEAMGAPGLGSSMSGQNLIRGLQQINPNGPRQLAREEIDAINKKRTLQQNNNPLNDLRMRLQNMQQNNRPLQPPQQERPPTTWDFIKSLIR